jgi:glucose-6-phosphate 1-dehydrogenase
MAHLDRELPTVEEAQAAPPRQAGACAIVIFGASGDLTARKLIPALYNLAKSNMLSREFAIVGVARNDYSVDQFRQIIGERLQNFATTSVDGDLREWLLKRLYYVSGEFGLYAPGTDPERGRQEPQHSRQLFLLSGHKSGLLR